jgi:acyl-CoA thioester hydrolase
MLKASVEILVPFHDVDTMEIAWHGHYVKYFEIARCELLNKLGYNYKQMRDSGYAWPVIDLHIRYPGPATFDQTIIVTATLKEWENRLRIQYEIREALTKKKLTKGETVQVAVNMETQQMCYESPKVLLDIMAELEASNQQATQQLASQQEVEQ